MSAPGADEPLVWYEGAGTSDKRWLIPDERGSVVAVTNGSGDAIDVKSYDEYGIPNDTTPANAGRFGYTGQAWLPLKTSATSAKPPYGAPDVLT